MDCIVIDDDQWYCELIAHALKLVPEVDLNIQTFASVEEAMKHIRSNQELIVTLDYFLENENGDIGLKKILKRNPHAKVILVSAQQDVETSVKLMKDGAYDYLVKNDNIQNELIKSIGFAVRELQLLSTIKQLNTKINNRKKIKLIGHSSAIKKIHETIGLCAGSDINVCISGETGAGKDLVANAIHEHSPRASQPFIAVNLAAISPSLFESELFGHEKGAFTGAINKHTGYIEKANNGTLFLDEIAELDIASQVKLLRVLEQQSLVRVGGSKQVNLNFRLITATHKNLIDEVEKGKFREDLYYRLYGVNIHIPPLRERKEDIPVLAKHFLKGFCKRNALPSREITKPALNKLFEYSFPGNVRELKSLIELACVLSQHDDISPEHFRINTEKKLELLHEEKSMKEYETEILKYYLNKYNNDVKKVASILKIGKSTIYKNIKEKKIELLT